MKSVVTAQAKRENLDSSSCKFGETELRTKQIKNGEIDGLTYLQILPLYFKI